MTTAASLPQYARIKRQLIAEIKAGNWSVGGSFPSEAELVAKYGVSRSTLVRSLQELVREGYLYRRQGQGTFVADYRHRERVTHPLPLFFHGNNPWGSVRASQVLLNIMTGIESALGAGLPGILVRQLPQGPLDDDTRALINTLRPRAAMVVEPSFNPSLMGALRDSGCVVWALNEPADDANCVYIDQERAGYMATRYLLEEGGRRRVALLNGPRDAYWGFAAKLRGYQRALEEAGFAFDSRLVREAHHAVDSEAGRAMLRAILVDDRLEIDGVVGVSDAKAIGAMALAGEIGMKVPDDLLIVSIDNTLAEEADPPLTSVAMPFDEVGRQAALQAKQAQEQSLESISSSSSSSSSSPSPPRPSGSPVVALQQIRLQPTLVRRTTSAPGARP
jgi:GntR family transcriptional regulator of arabinose operon